MPVSAQRCSWDLRRTPGLRKGGITRRGRQTQRAREAQGRARGGFWGGTWGPPWLLVEASPSQQFETKAGRGAEPFPRYGAISPGAAHLTARHQCSLLNPTLCLYSSLIGKPSVYTLNGLLLFTSASLRSWTLSKVKQSSEQTNNKTATSVLGFSPGGTVSRSLQNLLCFPP